MARSGLYALLSLGVKNILVYNRTLANATALVERYKQLLENDEIPELESGSASQVNLRVLESLDTAWPSNFRAPTMIISGIPTQKLNGSPNDFVLPEAWLKSPTGGVVLEVRPARLTSNTSRR
jgi:shikimate 5-dehydrogenase